MSKQKSIAKSIRLTDEVFAYIDGYQGDGFNVKFENIILDAMLAEPTRKKRIKELDQQIARRRKELDSLLSDIDKIHQLARDAIYVSGQVSRMKQIVSQMHAAAPGSEPGVEIQEGGSD